MCRVATVLKSVAILAALCLSGCGERAPDKGVLGAASIDELTKRYKDAHERKDMAALLALCVWRAPPPDGGAAPSASQSTGQTLDEKTMQAIFDFPLREVKFEAGPPPDPVLGGEVIYYIPGAHQAALVKGSIYGKLVLAGTNGETLDLSYVVEKDRDRYWIDVIREVVTDAAAAVHEHHKPQYVAAPMLPAPDFRKGEHERTFK